MSNQPFQISTLHHEVHSLGPKWTGAGPESTSGKRKLVTLGTGRKSGLSKKCGTFSLLDIVISVFLILVVTQISHGVHLEDILLTAFFIGGLALVKVSLDRFFIIPRLNNWGWRFFSRSIHGKN
ncbi:MAG: hypothetical protein ACFFD4_20835 [Candidatus Odinarchaeota archaeon]